MIKLLKGFETEAVRITLLSENDIQAYYVREVGMLARNEHDVMKKFDSFDEAAGYYDALNAVLIANGVKIIKTF